MHVDMYGTSAWFPCSVQGYRTRRPSIYRPVADEAPVLNESSDLQALSIERSVVHPHVHAQDTPASQGDVRPSSSFAAHGGCPSSSDRSARTSKAPSAGRSRIEEPRHRPRQRPESPIRASNRRSFPYIHCYTIWPVGSIVNMGMKRRIGCAAKYKNAPTRMSRRVPMKGEVSKKV